MQYPVEVKKSISKDRGVFAARNIPCDAIIEKCPVLQFQEFPAVLKDYIFVCEEVDSKKKYILPLGYGCLYNHASEANAHQEFAKDRAEFVVSAKRDIAKGEEIFIYYSNDWFELRGIKQLDPKALLVARKRKNIFRTLGRIAVIVLGLILLKLGLTR